MNNTQVLTSETVVQEARKWIGTRFHHQGRTKSSDLSKGACDCLGLLIGIAKSLQLKARDGRLLEQFDEKEYGHYPEGIKLIKELNNALFLIDNKNISFGDVLLMKMENTPQHVALVCDYTAGGYGIIHAYAAMRKVVEHRLDEQWERRVVAAYRLPQLMF
jgi:cell wall-associated NlpC family hydrolase